MTAMIAPARRVANLLGQAPFTATFIVLLWSIGLFSGALGAGPDKWLARHIGAGVPALRHGRWWTPVTSLLWCDNLVAYVATTVLLIALCAPAERRFGVGRTVFAFVTTHVAGVLAAAGLVTLGARASDWCARDLVPTVAVGPSTAAAGVALAFSAQCSPLLRRRIRLVLLVTLAMLALYSGTLQDVLRLFAGVAGLLLGPLLARGAPLRRPSLPSRPELRLLLAVVTAASAAGPLIAAISSPARGPLFTLQYVFLPYARQVEAESHAGLVSPAFLSLMPVVLLIVLAEGLRRGRRSALVGTIATNVALGVLGIAELLGSLPQNQRPAGPKGLEQLFATAASAAHPLAVAAILVVCHRSFAVSAPRRLYRRRALAAVGALVALSAMYVIIGGLVAEQFVQRPHLGRLLLDLPMQFIPPGYLEGVDVLVPVGPVATALHQWTGVVFWAIVLSGLLSTFWYSRVDQRGTDQSRARELLRQYGGSELSYMTTWRGNKYWFSADGRVVVTYRLVGPVALTVGDPIGDPSWVPAAAVDFTRFCMANGWTPCFYSVGDPLASTLDADGWKLVQVAEETRLPLANLAFTGKRWQDVRTAINRAKRSGITAQWHTYSSSPADVSRQIRAISAQWVADKGMPEMGFTLGGLTELSDDEVRCLLAVDADGRVEAVTSWMPVYRNGSIEGWTLDLMRRRRGVDNGLMEFLIATAAVQFQTEGANFVSLSGAPLARIDRGQPATSLQRMLDRLGLALEPVYGFRSLLAFKSKFQPEYRPLYMAYPEAVALPAIGSAVARAYLPDLTVPQGLRLAGRALRQRRRGGAAPKLTPVAKPSSSPVPVGASRAA